MKRKSDVLDERQQARKAERHTRLNEKSAFLAESTAPKPKKSPKAKATARTHVVGTTSPAAWARLSASGDHGTTVELRDRCGLAKAGFEYRVLGQVYDALIILVHGRPQCVPLWAVKGADA